jgi:predicted ATPase
VHELDFVPEVRLLEPRAFNSEPPLYKLYTLAVEQGRREQAKAIVAEIVPRMKDLEILAEGDRPIVHVVFADHSVPVAVAGDGVYSLTRLILELAARPDGSVLLEEPEVHQHPGAIRQTMRAVLAAVRRDIQVILTTHSLELIDVLLAESSDEDLEKLSLYRLNLEDGRLTTRRMPGSEVAFSRCEVEKDLR